MVRDQSVALYNDQILTGTITTDTSTILTEVQDEYKVVFGSDLNINPETPQGLLITLETLARSAVADNNAALANQINPNIAGGVFLDAILALTGAQRTPATASTVVANVTGVALTVIPTTAVAVTTDGYQFSPETAITIGAAGTASGTFIALTTGPIGVPIGALNKISVGVPGWETVNNTVVGILGTNTQSDLEARRLRQNTLAIQGQSLAEAITGGLYLSGVSSLKFQENTSASSTVINGVTMGAHSIYTSVTNNSPLRYLQVLATLAGTAGTTITTSAIASDGTHQYSPVSDVVIGSDGTVLALFQALVEGTAQNVSAGALTTIVSGPAGWASVTNTYPSFAYDYSFLYDVAYTLMQKKSAGAAYSTGPGSAPYGPQNINVTEPTSGQTQLISFDAATPVAILAQVTVIVTPAFTGDPTTTVQTAIVNYATNGNSQEPGFTVGTDVSPWDLATAVNLYAPGLYVSLIEISYASSVSFSTNTLTINIWEQATIAASSITVYVNYPAGYNLI